MDLKNWIRTERQDFRALFERAVLQRVPREQLTMRPDGTGNSIAWLMWHLARTEDVLMAVVARGENPILAGGGWQERLGVADLRVGTAFSDQEVESLSRGVNIDALDAYWTAVRAATDAWLNETDVAFLETVPDFDARLSTIAPIVGDDGRWLLDFWRGHSVGWFLRFSVIGHSYLHLGQMQEIAGRLGIKGR